METTKNKAIEAAKKELRNLLGVKRLSYVSIKGSSTQCECGETYAVEVTGKSGGKNRHSYSRSLRKMRDRINNGLES